MKSRRHFIKTTGAAGLSLATFPLFLQGMKDPVDRYSKLKTGRYLKKVKVETTISDVDVFTEGPAVDRMGNVFFTNIRTSKILKWVPKTKTLSTYKTDSNEANGLRFLMNGDLLVCEGGSGKITKINMGTGASSLVADQYNGKGFQAPNDIEFDAAGRIYFSSRTNAPDLEKVNKKSVFRIDPDGSVHQLLTEPQVHMPNGVVISPDEKTLYLIEAHAEADHNRSIVAFDLKDGELSNQRTIIDFYPGRSGDGMCIDAQGNLYVGAGLHATRNSSETLDTRPGIHVISPQGKLLAFRETPVDTITNCSFGGPDLRTLYVVSGTHLTSIRTKIPGKKTYRPDQ